MLMGQGTGLRDQSEGCALSFVYGGMADWQLPRTGVGAYVLKYEVLTSVYPITYEISA